MNHKWWNCIKQWLGKYWWVVILLMLVVGIPFALEKHIRNNVLTGYEDTWAASEGSYWGGIVGGVISGTLACIGVFATIRYYRESDIKKERAAVMPFFKAREEEYNIDYDYVYLPRDNERAQSCKGHVAIAIQNIGNGFAHVEDIRCKEDKTESYVGLTLTKDQGMHLFLMTKDANSIDEIVLIRFQDSMSNCYVQSIHIQNGRNGIVIKYEYPLLAEKKLPSKNKKSRTDKTKHRDPNQC